MKTAQVTQPKLEKIEIKVEGDSDADTSYLEQEGFEEELANYREVKFGYVGVYAKARVTSQGYSQWFRTPGLWGIEDTSKADYFVEVAKEELDQLKDELTSYNVDISNFDELAEQAIDEM
jgi:hypothetical protein